MTVFVPALTDNLSLTFLIKENPLLIDDDEEDSFLMMGSKVWAHFLVEMATAYPQTTNPVSFGFLHRLFKVTTGTNGTTQ